MTDQTPATSKALTPIQQISSVVDGEEMHAKIAASLDGTGISAERFKRTALVALGRPEAAYLVEKCSRVSIYTALMNAAAAGLDLHPALGHAYLIPRGGSCQLQMGYKGYIALAARAGLAVEADVIYEGDKYSVRKGTNPEVSIEPEFDPAKQGEWAAVYVITHYSNGAKTLTFMTRAEVEKLRDKHSDAFKRGGAGAKVWKEHPAEMAKKTCIRRAAKIWPISIPGGSDEDGDIVEHEAPAPRSRDITPTAHLDGLAASLTS